MGKVSADGDSIGAATRGQIVQRVLVDGWSPAQAAASFGIGERQVARWVAAYRRYGMASLRQADAAGPAPFRWLRRLRSRIERMLTSHQAALAGPGAAPVALPRRHDLDHRRRRPAAIGPRSGTERPAAS